ncbi:MAG: hypothetical protein ACRELC_10870 [Gemmatimonadota bacterium]
MTLLALLPLPLLAQGQEGEDEERIDSPYRWIERGLRVGLYGGYQAANRGNLDFGQGPTALGGARFRVRVSSPLTLELGVGYGPASRWVIDPRLETGPAPVDTVSAGWLRTEIGVQLGVTGSRTWHGLHPYALFGGGFVFGVNEEASEAFSEAGLAPFRYDVSTAPHLYVGLGAEIFPSDRIGLGFELRDYLVRLKAPDGFFQDEILRAIEELGGEAPKETQWPHNPEFSLGLWYYF